MRKENLRLFEKVCSKLVFVLLSFFWVCVCVCLNFLPSQRLKYVGVDCLTNPYFRTIFVYGKNACVSGQRKGFTSASGLPDFEK